MNIMSKGQRLRSQGNKLQKGDRVAGVSVILYSLDEVQRRERRQCQLVRRIFVEQRTQAEDDDCR